MSSESRSAQIKVLRVSEEQIFDGDYRNITTNGFEIGALQCEWLINDICTDCA